MPQVKADKKIELDASGKILGRVATKAAKLLRGKDLPSFQPNQVPDREVVVKNASKFKVSGRKNVNKKYYSHTGYPGGIKSKSLKEIREEDPSQAIRHAVAGMLPNNKLKDKMLKNLTVYNGQGE